MKITNVEAIGLQVALKDFMVPNRNYLLTKITTDEGIVGWGQIGTIGHPELAMMLVNRLKPILMGQDPFDMPKFWDKWFDNPLAVLSWGHKGAEAFVMSGVDIALWDIVGKACNKPIHKLLGGARDKIRLYASHGEPEKIDDYIANGFTAFKFGTSHPSIFPGKVQGLQDLDDTLKKLRKTVGDDFDLMIDAWQGYSLPAAMQVAKLCEKHNVVWFEEPILSYDFDGMAAIAKSTTVPLAAGEHQYTSREAADLILKSGIQFVQCDVVTCGGISEAFKVAAIARSRGITYQPHCTETPVNFAAMLQVVGAVSNAFLAEWQVGHSMGIFSGTGAPLRWDLIKEPFKVKNGWVEIPNKPGLGIEIDEKAVEKYRWKI